VGRAASTEGSQEMRMAYCPPSGCGDNHENQDRALRERVAAPAAGDG
jgi:hypothetical protein